MTANLWTNFKSLLPADPLLVGDVVAWNADGTSSIELPGAQFIKVQGQGVAVGQRAFVQTGRVQTQAPSLPLFNEEL